MFDIHNLFSENTTDTNHAQEIVQKHYGGLESSATKVFKDGFDHAVLVVDGTTAFRFPKNQEYLEKLPVVSNFLREFAPLSPVPVPASEVFSDDEIAYEVYRFLPGKPLKEDLAATFSGESLERIAAGLGSFLATLHSFSAERAAELGVPANPPLLKWQERYAAIRRNVYSAMSSAENEWITHVFEKFLPLLDDDSLVPKVTHFDIKPDHIIVNPSTQELTGIIDFGDMEIGDPAYDFTFLASYKKDLTPYVLDAYQTEKDDSFTTRVGIYQNLLPLMELDHALQIGAHEKVEELKHRLANHIASSHLL